MTSDGDRVNKLMRVGFQRLKSLSPFPPLCELRPVNALLIFSYTIARAGPVNAPLLKFLSSISPRVASQRVITGNSNNLQRYEKKRERGREEKQEIALIIIADTSRLFSSSESAGENFAYLKVARENARKRWLSARGIHPLVPR